MVLEHANLFTSLNIKDLGRSIATSCNIFAIMTEPDAAYDTFVVERVDEVHIENTLDLRVENRIPILPSLLVVRGHRVNFKVSKSVANGGSMWASHSAVFGGRMADLRGGCTSRVRHGGVNLGSSRSDGTWWTTDTPSTGAGRGGTLGLGAHPIGNGARRIVLRVRCLLRVRVRRRDGKSRRPLAHLVLRSQRLLLRSMSLLRLLLLLRALGLALLTLLLARLRRNETSLATASHDATKKTIARSDRRGLLRGRCMLRRAGNARLDASLSSSLELVS